MPLILIVDDEAAVRGPYTMILRLAGYDVCAAADGEEALMMLAECPIDLVLLDLAMPRHDGLTVLRTMNNHPDGRRIPVVVVTSLSEEEARRRVEGLPVAGLLMKSRLSRDGLLAVVSEALVAGAAGV